MADRRNAGGAMSVKTTIKFKGVNELAQSLKKLPDRVENKVLQSAVNSGLLPAKKAIIAAAPLGPDKTGNRQHRSQRTASDWARIKKYGHLKKQIKIMRLKRVGYKERAARVTTGKAFWAFWYELGNRRQPARPFFLPAFTKSVNQVLETLSDKLAKGIEREFKKK